MSMLSSQAKALRSWADQLSEREDEFGVVVRSLVADLREAADTIESLRDRLQEDGEQTCHATQANYEHCKYSTDRGWRDTSKYAELFGTPERAAKTVSAMCSHGIWSCDGCPLFDEGVEHCESELGDTPSLLEWLRGGA